MKTTIDLKGKSGKTYIVDRVINNTTKKARNWAKSWAISTDYELTQVYGRYSQEKSLSWYNIKKIVSDCGGAELMITGHNIMTYSCAWVLGGDLIIETYRSRYIIPNFREIKF